MGFQVTFLLRYSLQVTDHTGKTKKLQVAGTVSLAILPVDMRIKNIKAKPRRQVAS